jgi:hypothetical protein
MIKRSTTILILPIILAVILALYCGCGCTFETSTGIYKPSSTSSGQLETTGQSGQQSQDPTGNETSQPDQTDSNAILQEKMAAAPVIDGAEKELVDINGLRRVVYTALPDNPYGMPSGAILGEYKHEVYLGEERSGGVALAPPVAKRYLKLALDDLPSQQARWLLTLPVDLSDCKSLRPIRIDLSAKPFIDLPYYIRISADRELLGVVNILDEQQQVVIDDFKMYGLSYIISQRSLNSMKIISGEEMAFLFVIAQFAEVPKTGVTYTYGDCVGTTREPVLAGLSSVRGPPRIHDYNCILKIDGCPVFLMANRRT